MDNAGILVITSRDFLNMLNQSMNVCIHHGFYNLINETNIEY